MNYCDISFIIPVYNAEAYIERCVSSILQQELDNYEIILINDGSTDKSLEICRNLQKHHVGISLINQENKGQGAARNVGINVARGEWLCFIDDDDWLEPEFSKECSKYLNNDADIIFFARRDIYSHSHKDYLLNINEKVYTIDSQREKEILQLFTLNFYYRYPIQFGKLPVGEPWGKLIKADIIKKNNCYFVEGYGEDRPCMIKIYNYANKIFIINKVLYNYYVHESTMKKYLPNATDKYRKSLCEINQYVTRKFSKSMDFMQQLHILNITWFSYCIVQDFCHGKNPKKYKERKRDFMEALEDRYYKTAFKIADLSYLPFRRKILALLTKYKLFGLINILNRLNSYLLQIKQNI